MCTLVRDRLAAMCLFALLLVACSRDDFDQGAAGGTVTHAHTCVGQASESENRLTDSMKSVSPSTAVIVARRNHEQICLHEASCLGIEEARLGDFLQHCLDKAEHAQPPMRPAT